MYIFEIDKYMIHINLKYQFNYSKKKFIYFDNLYDMITEGVSGLPDQLWSDLAVASAKALPKHLCTQAVFPFPLLSLHLLSIPILSRPLLSPSLAQPWPRVVGLGVGSPKGLP